MIFDKGASTFYKLWWCPMIVYTQLKDKFWQSTLEVFNNPRLKKISFFFWTMYKIQQTWSNPSLNLDEWLNPKPWGSHSMKLSLWKKYCCKKYLRYEVVLERAVSFGLTNKVVHYEQICPYKSKVGIVKMLWKPWDIFLNITLSLSQKLIAFTWAIYV